jgi:glycosyltransferase involved in cell wall biosynthesis
MTATVTAPRSLVIAQMLESDGPGGAEMVLLRLADALRSRGHEIVPVGPATGCGWLAEQFRARGFVPEQFLLRRPVDWQCAHGMIGMLERRKVDVVHSHEFTMAVYGAAAAKWLRRPHVATMHGNQTTTTQWRRRVALRTAFRWSSAVVTVSRDTKRFLDAQLGLSDDVAQVVPNGVPTATGDRARVRGELRVGSDELLVVATGSLVERKGHALLVRALAAQPAGGAPWRLAIAGNGVERSRLEELVRELAVADRVHLLGHRSDVGDILAAADIFAMPSLWEGLPLALLEAMSAGKPIVASATSGIPEAITPEVDGLLTRPGDLEGLTAALHRLRIDSALRERLAERAAARARAEFSIEAMTTAYEEIYFGILGHPVHSGARAGERTGLSPTPATHQWRQG